MSSTFTLIFITGLSVVVLGQSESSKSANVATKENRQQYSSINRLAKLKAKIANEPDNPELLNSLGVGLVQAGNFKEAKIAFDKCLILKPDMATAYYNMSFVLRHNGLDEQALASAKTAVRLEPERNMFKSQLCALLALNGKHGEDVDCYDALKKTTEFSAWMMAYYAYSLIHSDRTSSADNILGEGLNKFPKSAMLWNAKGMALFKRKKYADAGIAFRNAISFDDDLQSARYNLAICELLTKNRTGAFEQYSILKVSAPDLAGELFKAIFQGKILRVK